MAQIVEARDPYTAGHLWRVARFSRLLGARLGLGGTDLFQLTLGAYLHDLGKVTVPDQVLNKKGRLESGELLQMQAHSLAGYRMLTRYAQAREIAVLARDHHEHWDGCGYPQQLDTTDIATGARIVGLCDAFDAMTSNRPYRDGMPLVQALELIREARSVQFDPAMVDAFLALGEEEMLLHIVGHSDLNRPLLVCPYCGPVVEMPADEQSATFCRVCTGKFHVRRNKTGRVWLEDFDTVHGGPEDMIAEPDMAHLSGLFEGGSSGGS
ncbi:MAG TPA: HD domain-containing protein [Thiolinea sp.]|nr:HD domain-containing protein [Thiolinea sp.]